MTQDQKNAVQLIESIVNYEKEDTELEQTDITEFADDGWVLVSWIYVSWGEPVQLQAYITPEGAVFNGDMELTSPYKLCRYVLDVPFSELF